jgi:hypothetical protein
MNHSPAWTAMSSRTCSSLVFIASTQRGHSTTAAAERLCEILLHHAGRHAHAVRNFIVAEILYVPQHNGSVPSRRKLPKDFAKPPDLVRGIDFRIEGGGLGKLIKDCRVLDVERGAATPFTGGVLFGEVTGYREQIGLHVAYRVRILDTKHPDIDFLSQIAGVRTVVQASVEERLQGIPMGRKQALDQCFSRLTHVLNAPRRGISPPSPK